MIKDKNYCYIFMYVFTEKARKKEREIKIIYYNRIHKFTISESAKEKYIPSALSHEIFYIIYVQCTIIHGLKQQRNDNTTGCNTKN